MASAASARHPAEQRGLLLRLLSGISKSIVWLLFALLFSIIIEWVGMLWWWSDQGSRHSQRLLQQELNYLNHEFRRTVITSDSVQYANQFMAISYSVLFEWTRLANLLEWLAQPVTPHDPHWLITLKRSYHQVAEFALAAITISQVFAVRLAVLTLALPAFVLFAVVALVDGLVQRDLRRWCGGRESAFIYHHAKKVLFPSLLLAWVIYLALPFSLHPSYVILPFAALFALALAITATTFKKYL